MLWRFTFSPRAALFTLLIAASGHPATGSAAAASAAPDTAAAAGSASDGIEADATNSSPRDSTGAAPLDFRLAPSDAELASRSDSIRARKRNGAIALFGSLGVASVIIGVVRARARSNKRRQA